MLAMPWKESKTRVQKAEDGDASQKKKEKETVRKESRCRAQNNTQEDRKLRDKYCAENRRGVIQREGIGSWEVRDR